MAIVGMIAKTSGSGQSPSMAPEVIKVASVRSAMILIARIAVMPETKAVFGCRMKTKRMMAIADKGCRPARTSRDQMSPPSAKSPTAAVKMVKRTLMTARAIKIRRNAVMRRF